MSELLKPPLPPPPSQPQPRASSSSLLTASLPGRPTENPSPTRSHIPTLLARPTHPQGDLSPGCSGGRPGQARRGRGRRPGGDAGKTVSEAGESWAGTGRLRRLGPQRPRSASLPAPQACPPERRKRRRLGSAHAQFKLSPRPPPLPQAAAPRARRLPAAPLAPLTPGRSPARPEVAEYPCVPSRGRDRRRPGAEAHPWCCS